MNAQSLEFKCKVCGSENVIMYRGLLICLNCSTVALEKSDRELGDHLEKRFGRREGDK